MPVVCPLTKAQRLSKNGTIAVLLMFRFECPTALPANAEDSMVNVISWKKE
jgi:hypothetical protein